MVAMLIGYVIVGLSYLFRLNPNAPRDRVAVGVWVLAYFVGARVISYFGDFGSGGIIGGIGIFKHVLDHGGNDDLGLVGGLLASAAWSWSSTTSRSPAGCPSPTSIATSPRSIRPPPASSSQPRSPLGGHPQASHSDGPGESARAVWLTYHRPVRSGRRQMS